MLEYSIPHSVKFDYEVDECKNQPQQFANLFSYASVNIIKHKLTDWAQPSHLIRGNYVQE